MLMNTRATRTNYYETNKPAAQQIQSQLHAQHVECVDVSDNGCDGGAKLELLVVSSLFEGKTPLARHRLVNTAVSELMDGIHALTIQAWTPAQYEAKSQTL